MSLVLGLDAGNTKTIALLATCDGRIIGSGRGGCGDIYAAGSPEQALAAMDSAIAAALPPGAGPDAITAACFSMAGADWPEDYALIRAALLERGLDRGERSLIYNDALGALRAGTADGVGVSVVCGTGAAVGARAADGRFWHSSWWQEPQGAQQLGQKTLRAVYRAALGLAPPTSLTGRVLDFYQAPDVETVLHRLTARVRQPAPPVGQLSRALLDEAAAGDPTARSIVVAHGADLGDYALVAARRGGLSDPSSAGSNRPPAPCSSPWKRPASASPRPSSTTSPPACPPRRSSKPRVVAKRLACGGHGAAGRGTGQAERERIGHRPSSVAEREASRPCGCRLAPTGWGAG
jgi:N-acetylglucosamine kinase-like BadF-type ATPase